MTESPPSLTLQLPARESIPDRSIALADIFPLPLVPFERYMLADDRLEYPMTIPVILEFTGELRQPAFVAALRDTLAQHPLLRAHLDTSSGREPQWIEAPEWLPAIDWDVTGTPARFPIGTSLDLRRETGLRMSVRVGPERSTLTAQFHHACADGAGTTQFLGELLARYATLTGGSPPPNRLPVRDPATLRRRGEFAVPKTEPVSLGRIVWVSFAELVKFAVRRIAPMAALPAAQPVTGRDSDEPAIESHEFNLQETEALQLLASAHGAKLNDILLRDLFQVVAQWNAQSGELRPSRWLLINMPKNMREPADGAMPAANRMSYAFLTRRAREVEDTKGLLEYVRNETELVRKYGLGHFFLGNIVLVQSVPGMLNWLLSGERCFATTILSNFGNVTRQMGYDFPVEEGRLVIGNVRLERWQVAAPVRHLTRTSFAALTYAGRLTICLRCDPRYYSSGSARELLACYVERIRKSIADGA